MQTDGQRRRLAAARAARRQGGVLSRRQLYALGCTRSELRAEVAAGRWVRLGPQCLRVGPPDASTAWWRAVFEVGPHAVLDGASALLAAGLRTIGSDTVHIAVPKSTEFRRCRGACVHETRRYRHADIVQVGIPRTKPATATVHAALWARSDSEAALFVVAAVQQRLVNVADLAEAVHRIKRHRRRALLLGLVRDVVEGVESIGEREFAAGCRRRRFPPPTRQFLRRLPSGRCYYDVVWELYGVEVEIDGVQHLDAVAAIGDALKQNAASLAGSVVLRIPFLAFRTDPEPFLDQVEAALRSGGWTPTP